MDLRDEVAGTDGTIWLNHFLRTGFEMFTRRRPGWLCRGKGRDRRGWVFPVGDEVAELGYIDMFADMFGAIDEGRAPRERLYDGYVVNAVMDAVYRSAQSRAWEPVSLFEWRGGLTPRIGSDRRDIRRSHGHQARDPARRPPQAHPQGPGQGRLPRPGRGGRGMTAGVGWTTGRLTGPANRGSAVGWTTGGSPDRRTGAPPSGGPPGGSRDQGTRPPASGGPLGG